MRSSLKSWWTGLLSLGFFMAFGLTVQAATNHLAVPCFAGLLLETLPPPPGMSEVPAGNYKMGDTLDGMSWSMPAHTVFVSRIYVDQAEVSKDVWDAVRAWGMENGYTDLPVGEGLPGYPVAKINWYDALKWCNARSELEGLSPVYFTSPYRTEIYRTGQININNLCANWSSDGYRLPTEAEWEKAARGGVAGLRYPWGFEVTCEQANYTKGCWGSASAVTFYPPNGYGLRDMAGNIAEWCWDRDGNYSAGLATNPHGPDSGNYRILRGGDWSSSPSDAAERCRVARRSSDLPDAGYSSRGFRTVRQR